MRAALTDRRRLHTGSIGRTSIEPKPSDPEEGSANEGQDLALGVGDGGVRFAGPEDKGANKS